METIERRYDIDWLRVIAIGLLLIYHIAITFQPWGVFIGFIQNDKPLESLWIPMSMLNVWRIPLLFFVSGMGVCFAMRKRNWKQLVLERTKRILIPFLFGIFAIVPLHVLIWQKYYNQDLSYVADPSHLWFLGNIFVYVLVLFPVFYLMQRNDTVVKWLNKIFKSPFALLMVAVPFVVETLLVNPEPYEMYAMTFHGFLVGLMAFFFGFSMALEGKFFWETAMKWRWLFLAIAFVLFLVRLLVFEIEGPAYLKAFEGIIWILAVFGFGYKYLNKPSKSLSYLSQGAYPIYIVHMFFQFLAAFLILPLEISASLKLLLVVAFTTMGSFALYDLVIKRIGILRPLFGLKQKKRIRVLYKAS